MSRNSLMCRNATVAPSAPRRNGLVTSGRRSAAGRSNEKYSCPSTATDTRRSTKAISTRYFFPAVSGGRLAVLTSPFGGRSSLLSPNSAPAARRAVASSAPSVNLSTRLPVPEHLGRPRVRRNVPVGRQPRPGGAVGGDHEVAAVERQPRGRGRRFRG